MDFSFIYVYRVYFFLMILCRYVLRAQNVIDLMYYSGMSKYKKVYKTVDIISNMSIFIYAIGMHIKITIGAHISDS